MHNGIWRYFTNRTHPSFIEDPFRHIIAYEKGQIPKHHTLRKVGFQELFYDLFVVAALNVFSSDSGMGNGTEVASYVVFFAAIWAIWASQTVFDVRYGAKDGMMWIFGYFQLCVFGIMAAVSGDFDLSMGTNGFEDSGRPPSHQQFEEYVELQHWVSRPAGELKNASATLRSLTAASGAFAISRTILMIQYLIVLHYAKKHQRSSDKKAIYWHIGGLLVSAIMWFAALGVSFSNSRATAIARITLWAVGLVFEFVCMCAAALAQSAHNLDLEYWAERFSALTLIVLGEGIISLFEAFQSVLQGVSSKIDSSSRGVLAGLIVSAIGMYRLLYYLYFGQHSHRLRGGIFWHATWGCLHFPLHLSILLLTQCVSRVIFTVNTSFGVGSIFMSFLRLSDAMQPGLAARNMTELQHVLFLSPQAQEMQIVMSNINLDWNANAASLLTYAQNSTDTLRHLLAGQAYTSLAQLFTNFGFAPPGESYHYVNAALNTADEALNDEYINEYLVSIMKPLFVSMSFGITVLGGFFTCLGLLAILQSGPDALHEGHHHTAHKRPAAFFHRISMFYRLGLGIVLLLLTMLDIGSFWENADEEDGAAPIYQLTNTAWFLPLLFLITATAAMVDFGLFLWKQSCAKPVTSRQNTQLSNNSEKDRTGSTAEARTDIAVLPRTDSSPSQGVLGKIEEDEQISPV